MFVEMYVLRFTLDASGSVPVLTDQRSTPHWAWSPGAEKRNSRATTRKEIRRILPPRSNGCVANHGRMSRARPGREIVLPHPARVTAADGVVDELPQLHLDDFLQRLLALVELSFAPADLPVALAPPLQFFRA